MNKVKIEPPAFLFIMIVIAVILHFVLPVYKIIQGPLRLSGIILIIIGVWLNIWADNIFKRIKTTVKPYEKPSSLTVEGPFKFSRNPMYLGMLIILLGLVVILGSATPFIVSIAFYAIVMIFYIPFEEKSMEETFPNKFPEYKKKVRRWI